MSNHLKYLKFVGFLLEKKLIVEELLKEQEDSYIFFGEALVQIGAISEEQLIEELKNFNKLKLQSGIS